MKKIIYFTLFIIPTLAIAQSTNVDDVLDYVLTLVRVASGLLSSLAVLGFFYSLIMFIWKQREGKEDVSKSKDMLIWSAIALFMTVGIWTIVGYVQTSVGTDIVTSEIDETPLLPFLSY